MRRYLLMAKHSLTGEYLGCVDCHSLCFEKVTDELSVSAFINKLFEEHSDYACFDLYIVTPRFKRIKKHIGLASGSGWAEFEVVPNSSVLVCRAESLNNRLILKEV